MAKNKKCDSCGKAMSDKEYIAYLEKEKARLERELAAAKLYPTPVTIPWTKPYWEWPPPTITWGTNNVTASIDWDVWNSRQQTSGTQYCYPSYDIMQPTGDMCSNTCRMNGLDKNGGCLQCGRKQPPMGTGLL